MEGLWREEEIMACKLEVRTEEEYAKEGKIHEEKGSNEGKRDHKASCQRIKNSLAKKKRKKMTRMLRRSKERSEENNMENRTKLKC